MLSDALPTSYEVGVEAARVQEGDRVAIIGCGPVGLSALLTVLPSKPSQVVCLDMNPFRLETAKKLGATHTLNIADVGFGGKIMGIISSNPERKPGFDVVIECAGRPESVALAQKFISVGGRISIVSSGLKETPINLFEVQRRKVTISSGFLDGHSTSHLIDLVAKGELDPAPLVSHKFKLSEVEKAYEVFSNPIENKTLKVLLVNNDE
ncbi:unnamed protein product [Ambrosiozyma monospora]|uniref:Unnamed protein product n=1 Tax=Ambrosiozyma monospora TaxID=43982 RepID=A0ACB5U9Z7_AMBMO|nr:unnamed protein product [Ambrosiozyma monospora]